MSAVVSISSSTQPWRLAGPLRLITRRSSRVALLATEPSLSSASAAAAAGSQHKPGKQGVEQAGGDGGDEAAAYDASRIQVLDGLDPVRKRPGMYIGSTGLKGLHHLVYEVVDNAVDEAQAGFASRVDVEVLEDGSVSVSDDGRGIPVDVHPKTGKSALETVLTVLHAGGKFGGDNSGYTISGGLHGVGISVCNALSEFLNVTVWREGRVYRQEYERGRPMGELRSEVLPSNRDTSADTDADADSVPNRLSGTRVHFKPDPLIFTTTTDFDYSTLSTRLRELAFLNSGLAITLVFNARTKAKAAAEGGAHSKGKRSSSKGGGQRSDRYYFEGGLQEYVSFLTADKGTLFDPIHLQRQMEGVGVEISLQWCSETYSDTLLGYANSIRTVDGGTHLEGFKTALTRTVNTLARKARLLKDTDSNLSGDFIREGLTGVVSVKVPHPEFEGQTKTRLGNPEARRIVDLVVSEFLLDYFDIKQNVLAAIVQRALQAARAADAARKARDLVRRKTVLRSTALPGKLADCASTDPKKSEIFIVEGDSAGGSAKQARDRRFQAILPLRGKILNVEKSDEAKMYKNTEIQALITGLGLGLRGEAFDLAALRYRRIIILTDADVDGAHIRTLLLTFFFRYRRELFEHGLVFVGVPPLYKVETSGGGKKASATYLYDDAQLEKHIELLGANAKYHVQRFKGLGEMMPQQLWDTTMDPKRRLLKRLTVQDMLLASDTIAVLMGDKVEPRRQLIAEEGAKLKQSELDI